MRRANGLISCLITTLAREVRTACGLSSDSHVPDVRVGGSMITLNRYVRSLTAMAFALALVSAGLAKAALIVAPNSLANVEGDVSQTLNIGLRYQQVFGASQFSAIPAGGAFLTQIAFRPDQTIDTP